MRLQICLDRLSTALRQIQVELVRPGAVGVTVNFDDELRMLLQRCDGIAEDLIRLRRQFG